MGRKYLFLITLLCALCISVDAIGAPPKRSNKRGAKSGIVVKPHLAIANIPFDNLPTTSSPDLYLKSSPYKVANVSYESHYKLGGYDALECPIKLEYKFDEYGRIIEYISDHGCGGTNYKVKYLSGSNKIASINLEYTPEGTDYEEDVTIKATYIPTYKGDKIISLKETTTSFGGKKTNKTFNYNVSYRDDDIFRIKCVEVPKVYFEFPHFASYGIDYGYHVLYIPSGKHHGWTLESAEGHLYNNDEPPMKLPDGVKPNTDYQDNWISASWQFTGEECIHESARNIGYFWPDKNKYDLEFNGIIANNSVENSENLESGSPLSWRLSWDKPLESFNGQSMHHGHIFTLKGHLEGNVYKVSEFLNDGSLAYRYECNYAAGSTQAFFEGKYYNGNYPFEFIVKGCDY